MKVYFIGAGPGAADLITLRGANILGAAPLVMYAGSLVSREMLVHCRADAEIVDTSGLSLDEQEAVYRRARNAVSTSRGCIRETRRSMAPWPSR